MRLRIQWLKRRTATLVFVVAFAALAFVSAPARAERDTNVDVRDAARFDIASGPLADALDRFGDQSGLQIVYDPRLIAGRIAAAVSGRMRKQEALDRLLVGSGVGWKQVNTMTIMLVEIDPAPVAPRRSAGETNIDAGSSDVVALGDVQ